MGLIHKGRKARRMAQRGSIGDLLTAICCVLAMVIIMKSFMDCVALVNVKTMTGQIARNYVLKMETVGYLTAADELALMQELGELGISDASLEGTTRAPVPYGSEITLKITGRIGGEYFVEEKRVTTAKQ